MTTLDYPEIFKSYDRPHGLPLYWRGDITGVLPAAVEAYINHVAYPNQYQPPTAEQLELLGQFVQHFINAPCWELPDSPFVEELAKLRAQAKELKTVADFRKFVVDAMEIGLDPF